MASEGLHHYSFSGRLDCRFVLDAPPQLDSGAALVVALHGFASNPETMLRLLRPLVGEQHVLAALEGPYQFYTSPAADSVGFGWITRHHAASSVRLHHDMVLETLNLAGREYGIASARHVLAGFSQPVGLNYRFAATHPEAVRGVIGICGGLPSDWETGAYRTVEASLLHIARKADEVYPEAVTTTYPSRLRLRAADVEFHLLEGGHRVPSRARPLVNNWLARILR